ncbi:MAG: hypothetical protein RMI91_10065 [Gemmatales bacterium]|nr:hypothetical protein [Gemmatales bacterium]MDW7994986.1 hypothetical protein [Gemmatales bacterium]
MARRAARTETASRGTHPVVIVFLVFSILLALVLGVLLYLEKDKTKQARAAEQRARQELSEANKRVEMFGVWLLPLALAWVYPENEALKDGDFAEACRRLTEYLNTPEASRPKDVPDIFLKALEYIQKPEVLGDYGIKQGGRLEPFREKNQAPSLPRRLQQAMLHAADFKRRLDDLQAKLDRLQQEYDNYKAQWNENRLNDELARQREQHQKELARKEQEHEARLKGLQAKLQALSQDMDDRIKKLLAQADEEKKQLLLEMNKRLAQMEAEVAQVRAAARPRLELARLIQPSGRILSASPAGDSVIIDRGQVHRLPEGITFSVYPQGPDGRLVPKIKAMIQVVRVNRDTAVARVTRMVKPEELRDPTWEEFDERYWITEPTKFVLLRDPIRPGDFIYNSAWKPDEPVHLALAGLIDLDGDGKDDSDMFKRLLQERGVVVDLHLRYTEAGYVTEGRLSERTDMLVVGINPGFRVIQKPQEGEEGKPVETRDPFEMLEEEARRRGMDIVGVRLFLLQMGFLDLRALVRGAAVPAKPAEPEKPEAKP